MLLVVTSERSPTILPDAAPAFPTVMRQRVVIFIIDTSDYFDAHGTYVQSVVQQQCAACDIHLVNLHGDVGEHERLVIAWRHEVHAAVREVDRVALLVENEEEIVW